MKRIIYISERVKITQTKNTIFVYEFINNNWSICYNAMNPNRAFIKRIIDTDQGKVK